MVKRILIDAVYRDETRVVILENNKLQDIDYETAAKRQIKGNIYLAKVTRVEPSLQAAFIDYGGGKNGFLPFAEIHPMYYNIPVSDREEDSKDSIGADNAQVNIVIPEFTPPSFTTEDEEEEARLAEEEGELIGEKVESSEITDNQEPDFKLDDNIDDAEFPEDDDVDEEISSKKKNNLYKNYKIQEVIKKNQIILVQVIKEERGNKGASFTSYLSLAGRYCVLMPNSDRGNGISRRISNIDDRKRLKSIVDGLNVPEQASVIIRTAGSGRSKLDIKRDYDYLVRLWNSIRNHTLKSTAPAFIHAEGDLLKRCIRDTYDNTVSEILIQGEDAYRQARDFMQMIIPNHVQKVKGYKNKVPIFCKYQIEEQISSLYSQIAHLESGGYIVINPTEALISIDVNSGRSTSEKNIEETAYKTNLEAAKEISRQVRLRDLSGIIVVDFIDMMELKNRRAVERAFREYIAKDKAKIQIEPISSFGLLQMSRQRLRPSFNEANTVACSHCGGKGHIRADESNAVMIMRTIESEIYKGDYEVVNLYAHNAAILYLMNNKRKEIENIEKNYNTKIIFHFDNTASPDIFSIETIKRSNKSAHGVNQPLKVDDMDLYNIDTDSTNYSEEELENISDENEEVCTDNYNNRPSQRRRGRKNFKHSGKKYSKKKPRSDEKSTGNQKSKSLIAGFLKRILD